LRREGDILVVVLGRIVESAFRKTETLISTMETLRSLRDLCS
jgi:hypothetical protein